MKETSFHRFKDFDRVRKFLIATYNMTGTFQNLRKY